MSINENLPNAEDSFIDSSKLTDYLLSSSHPVGKAKAKFFTAFGFCVEAADQMNEALLQHGKSRTVVEQTESEHGVKYVVECGIETPDARNPCIRSVWIVEAGQTSPRLVTAYPGPVRDN
jgi:hypothetical protein